MISKELAKAVLSGSYKTLVYSDSEVIACNINIHELAAKCTDWAKRNKALVYVKHMREWYNYSQEFKDMHRASAYKYAPNPGDTKMKDFIEEDVILVDDIITTGLTLTQAIVEVQAKGKNVLFCLTLADAGK